MKKDLFYTIALSLLLSISFGFGYFTANLVKLQKPPMVVENITTNDSNYTENTKNFQEGEVVASVNSDKFHFLHCPGAKAIKEENKIYFKDVQEALSAGFVLAGNCK